jgi:hypothetical protein
MYFLFQDSIRVLLKMCRDFIVEELSLLSSMKKDFPKYFFIGCVIFLASLITLVLSINHLCHFFDSAIWVDTLIEDGFVRIVAIDVFIIRISLLLLFGTFFLFSLTEFYILSNKVNCAPSLRIKAFVRLFLFLILLVIVIHKYSSVPCVINDFLTRLYSIYSPLGKGWAYVSKEQYYRIRIIKKDFADMQETSFVVDHLINDDKISCFFRDNEWFFTEISPSYPEMHAFLGYGTE